MFVKLISSKTYVFEMNSFKINKLERKAVVKSLSAILTIRCFPLSTDLVSKMNLLRKIDKKIPW